MGLEAADASFLPEADRRAASDALQVWARQEGWVPTQR